MTNGQSICFNKELCALGNSLVVQGLGLGAFTAEDTGSIPLWGTKILQAELSSVTKKKKKKGGAFGCTFVFWPQLHTWVSRHGILFGDFESIMISCFKSNCFLVPIHDHPVKVHQHELIHAWIHQLIHQLIQQLIQQIIIECLKCDGLYVKC